MQLLYRGGKTAGIYSPGKMVMNLEVSFLLCRKHQAAARVWET